LRVTRLLLALLGAVVVGAVLSLTVPDEQAPPGGRATPSRTDARATGTAAPRVQETPTAVTRPDQDDVEATLDHERSVTATGAMSDYTQELRYRLTPRTPSGEAGAPVIGTATYDRSGTWGRIVARPAAGGEASVWYDAEAATLFWCTDTGCYDMSRTRPNGDVGPTTPFGQAVQLLTTVDPGFVNAQLSQRDPSQSRAFTVVRNIAGTAVRCARIESQTREGADFAERCFSAQGHFLSFTNGSGSVTSGAVGPGRGPVGLPGAVLGPSSAPVN